MGRLRVPCTYQGGKQRIAPQIVDRLLAHAHGAETSFYDLCCGSGAITVELVNRGVSPRSITMLDSGPWGTFWAAIGSGEFDLAEFRSRLADIPSDKRKVKPYMEKLAVKPVGWDAAYVYPILQSCSFGGKQIWQEGDRWANAFFRDYWEPTETSVRRSPANPMQPSPETLYRRMEALVTSCQGITCLRSDVTAAIGLDISDTSVAYLDPPYRGTTGYGYQFDVLGFVREFRNAHGCALLVSEGMPLSDRAVQVNQVGPNGGISGLRRHRYEEWLSLVSEPAALLS